MLLVSNFLVIKKKIFAWSKVKKILSYIFFKLFSSFRSDLEVYERLWTSFCTDGEEFLHWGYNKEKYSILTFECSLP